MSRNPKKNQLPLSPVEVLSTNIEVPRYDIEAPDLPTAPPSLILQTIKKHSAASSIPTPDVLPLMPSYFGKISATPAVLPISPPARVLFRGYELEPFTIFPPDGRNPYDDRSFPWVCVCNVVSGTRSGCGVLIGTRHVLTASHVIDWQAKNASVSIVQGGVTLATANATHLIAYEQIDQVTYNNADDDYAVLVLDSPLGKTFGGLGAREYDSGWDNETANWYNIAYSPDISFSTPTFQTGFFLDEDDFDLGGGRMLITKTGDFIKGMSGSPVFGFWPEGPLVVGVVSAGGSGLGDFSAIAGGSNLIRLIAQARSDFP
jgi:Trypsin